MTKPDRPDPPMMPSPEAIRWFESEPDAIDDDLELAVLIARLGMASNALLSHLERAVESRSRGSVGGDGSAKHTRDMIVSIANVAAVLHESLVLAGPHIPMLRVLAGEMQVRPDAVPNFLRLHGGNHPARAFIDRVRNRLAYHWDAAAIEPSVKDFAKNQRLIWLELDEQYMGVHTFALAVLSHALFPLAFVADEQESKDQINQTVSDLSDAVHIVTEFLTACLFGYLKSYGVERKIRGE